MPLYEYHCETCGATYEKLRRAQDADKNLRCPVCESREVKRLISAFATSARCGAGGGRGFT
jgi:putative FmdB family regulatory protein